jgi:tRNA threonylcarbamoyladenosine biosynthesis protein TsaB
MAIFLCIETSTVNCSVALFENKNLLSLKENNDGYQHAELLHSFIQQILIEHKIKKPDAIILGKGPGSYTGLRIGTAAAKGLCFAWNIPLIAADSLQSIAYSILDKKIISENDLICPLIDARRMEVYTAFYNNFGKRITDVKAEIITTQSFVEFNGKKIYFAGNGLEKCKTVLNNDNANFIEGILPSAKFLINQGIEFFNSQIFENLAYFEPYYLKEFLSTSAKKNLL